MRLNKHIVYMIFLTAVVCLAAVLTGLPRGERRSDCAVAIVPRSGIQILSDNPVRVRQGESAGRQQQRLLVSVGKSAGQRRIRGRGAHRAEEVLPRVTHGGQQKADILLLYLHNISILLQTSLFVNDF